MTLTRFWLWYVSFSENLMLRNMADGKDGYNLCCADPEYDSYLCSSVICLHREDNFEVLFRSAKEKVLFNLFFSHDCGFYHLWHNHFHLHESYRKEEVTNNKVVSLLIFSVSPMLNPFIYTLRNKQIQKAFKDSIKRIALLSSK